MLVKVVGKCVVNTWLRISKLPSISEQFTNFRIFSELIASFILQTKHYKN